MQPMLAASGSPLYDGLVIVHVVCALLGFGAVAISGVYGFISVRVGRDLARLELELRDAKRYFSAPGWVETLTLAVPFFGIAALLVKPHTLGIGQLWSMLALGIWVLAALSLVGVVRPAEARIRQILQAGSEEIDLSELHVCARKLGWGATAMDVGFVISLGLMIFQPH